MSDMIETPKIRVFLKTGQKSEADAQMLGLIRWKLVPHEPRVSERDASEADIVVEEER
jgi:hypothetical protein